MTSIQNGPWEPAGQSEGGGVVALDGEQVAIAGPAHVVVWSGKKRICSAEAPWLAPGVPRFGNEKLFWGPGVLDLRSGKYVPLEACRPAIWPGGGERPYVYAWSPDGDRLLATYATGDAVDQTRVTLFDGMLGQPIATLYRGNELPPEAAWVGRGSAVVGFRNLTVFDAATGAKRGVVTLEGGTITRLDSDLDERYLLAVDLNRSIVWIDQLQWRIVDRWDGRWLDAAIAPDGRFVSALDLTGKLHFACLADGHFQALGEAPGPLHAGSVAMSNDSVVIAGAGVAMRMLLGNHNLMKAEEHMT